MPELQHVIENNRIIDELLESHAFGFLLRHPKHTLNPFGMEAIGIPDNKLLPDQFEVFSYTLELPIKTGKKGSTFSCKNQKAQVETAPPSIKNSDLSVTSMPLSG